MNCVNIVEARRATRARAENRDPRAIKSAEEPVIFREPSEGKLESDRDAQRSAPYFAAFGALHAVRREAVRSDCALEAEGYAFFSNPCARCHSSSDCPG